MYAADVLKPGKTKSEQDRYDFYNTQAYRPSKRQKFKTGQSYPRTVCGTMFCERQSSRYYKSM